MMDWVTIETDVRRIVMELLDPIMKQNNNHKTAIQHYAKMILETKTRLDTLEVAVFQTNSK